MSYEASGVVWRPYSGSRLVNSTKRTQLVRRRAMRPYSRCFVSRTLTTVGSLSATSTQLSFDVYELVRQFGWIVKVVVS